MVEPFYFILNSQTLELLCRVNQINTLNSIIAFPTGCDYVSVKEYGCLVSHLLMVIGRELRLYNPPKACLSILQAHGCYFTLKD